MKLVELHEREARIFPRADLYGADGRSLLLPETRSLSAVELRDVAAGMELRVRGLVGYLPLTSEISLNLRPKFPIQNLWTMLRGANANYDRILSDVRQYASEEVSTPEQLLTRAFCHYLREILALGIARGYVGKPFRGYFRHRVNFARTVGTFLTRGDNVKVAGEETVFSSGLRASEYLKAGCLHFLRLLPRSKANEQSRRLLLEALNALTSVKAVPLYPGGESSSDELAIWLRVPYRQALVVYSILMGYTRVGFGFGQGSEMPSVLFSLDDIFEDFVRSALRDGLRNRGVKVFDGNLPRHQGLLFKDNQRFPTKPDLILQMGGVTVAIGDAKYKPRIDEVDRYQVISHTIASGAALGIWVSPSLEGVTAIDYVGAVQTGAKFYHCHLNVAGDLVHSTTQMVTAVGALIGA